MTQDEINRLWLVGENDPILLAPTQEINNFEHVQALADRMFHVMESTNGVGLSANQVGVPSSMFVMRWPTTDVELGGRRIIVNPKIVNSSADMVLYEEGCLSFPGLYFTVSRPVSVDVEYQNERGERVSESFTGWPARIFQHEYDHMLGKTFKAYASRLKLERAEKKRSKIIKSLTRRSA